VFDCLYCGESKDSGEASLEHAVPQFIGGSSAPARFQLKNVCKACNNRLGLFVDASYAKAWFTTNALAQAARLLCRSENDPGLPLTYIGHTQVRGLAVPDGFIAEHWIGPSGETVVWVRAHESRMDMLAGGNPITAKREPSTAFFVPTVADGRLLTIARNSLQRMFKGKKVRTILCATAVDESGVEITDAVLGFDLPNNDERAAAAAVLQHVASEAMRSRIGVNAGFDHRFVCKLALGVGYGLFGDPFLRETTTAELRRGLWPRKETPSPGVRGVSTLAPQSNSLARLICYPGTVVLLVMHAGKDWSLTLVVDQNSLFTVAIGPTSMTGSGVNPEEGYALVLVPYLDQVIELTAADLIAHRQGALQHPDLCLIDQRSRDAAAFWANF